MSESPSKTDFIASITADSRPEDLCRAAAGLESGHAVLMPEIALELRVSGSALCCKVRDPQPGAHRCEIEYEVLVENCRRALEATAFAAHLPPLPRHWIVVERHGDLAHGTLWTAP